MLFAKRKWLIYRNYCLMFKFVILFQPFISAVLIIFIDFANVYHLLNVHIYFFRHKMLKPKQPQFMVDRGHMVICLLLSAVRTRAAFLENYHVLLHIFRKCSTYGWHRSPDLSSLKLRHAHTSKYKFLFYVTILCYIIFLVFLIPPRSNLWLDLGTKFRNFQEAQKSRIKDEILLVDYKQITGARFVVHSLHVKQYFDQLLV